MSHAIRPVKIAKGKALSKNDFVKLPSIIDQCAVYYDHKRKNFWFVYKENGKIQKYVFGRYEINGKQEFTLITAGQINECNLLQKEIELIK